MSEQPKKQPSPPKNARPPQANKRQGRAPAKPSERPGPARLVQDARGLKELCEHLRRAERIALDTEFISEKTYRPRLCLVQLATDELSAVVDPLAFRDLSPLWDAICRPSCELVVHAGRAELDFCLWFGGRLPGRVVDVQLLAGFVGVQGYPLSYAKLSREVLDAKVESSQTQSDWSRRPLSEAQLTYAQEDVLHLLPLRDRLVAEAKRLRRWDWYTEEVERWVGGILKDETPVWQRVQGGGALRGQDLAVLEALAHWREGVARELDRPRRRVLDDDVLVELAKTRPQDDHELERNRRVYGVLGRSPWLDDIYGAIEEGMALPERAWPRHERRPASNQNDDLLVKILSAVLGQIADERRIAATLVGTKEDLEELLVWHRESLEELPRLMRGWRADLCGRALADVVHGRLLIGVERTHRQTRLFLTPDGLTGDPPLHRAKRGGGG
jgi:ribonuclease D